MVKSIVADLVGEDAGELVLGLGGTQGTEVYIDTPGTYAERILVGVVEDDKGELFVCRG